MRRPPSATIRFATDATKVRLPARVLASASVRASGSVPAQAGPGTPVPAAAAADSAAPDGAASNTAAPTAPPKPVAGSSISTAGTLLTTVERAAVTDAVTPTTSSGPPPVGSQASS